MTPAQIQASLRGHRLHTVMRGSLRSVKEWHTQCLAQGIPAVMTRPCKDDGS